MSDYSTEAMKPKERPEVCPNCGKEIDWNGADTPVSEVCND